ncbi:hypothetical protein [Helicobacter bizzozeronii]|uniref:Uncharacterized protein n=1 Tax=Helicobacter bizzozeronii (strain CIII-1) TaxID=1002804 RepID=F8KRF7_HELBC|nr:hypothetical protein [Helicobacter bizzozeronii]CCB79338.1 hypothetical protein HBZC1_03520 [Helicobacter bizzozeronii CIII-1]
MRLQYCKHLAGSVFWIVLVFGALLPLRAIDIQALSNEQARSAELATKLVAVSHTMLEKAIDRGATYPQVKELNGIYQDLQAIQVLLSANNPNPNNPPSGTAGGKTDTKDKIESVFKKAIQAPIDFDQAIQLTTALQKRIKNTPQGSVDFTPITSLLTQLETSLQTALDLKSQWLNTRKAN